MQTSTAATWTQERVATATVERRPFPARSLLLLGAGLLTMALAVVSVSAWPDRQAAVGTQAPAAPGPQTAGLTISGPGDITVLNMTYAAGESSGWHAHRGIHAVAVLAGELAVYDTSCNRTSYGPDNPYIGGQQLHLIRNETGAAVPMVVTYLNPLQPAEVVPPPIATPPACAG